jgi:hypothetical protein
MATLQQASELFTNTVSCSTRVTSVQKPITTPTRTPACSKERLWLSAHPSGDFSPVVGLDGTHLRHSYKGEFYRLFVLYVRAEINYRPLGILLMAVALDVKGQLFPLAFGVCSVENQDNWEWFSRHLLQAIAFGPSRRITWLSDRQKGLINAVAALRPGDHHAFCLVHLKANFIRRFGDQGLVQLLWKVARATTEKTYNEVMKEMAGVEIQPNQHRCMP